MVNKDLEHEIFSVKPRLSSILKERNMTQLKLAELSKVPQSAISRFDTNKSHRDVHLVAISKALDITIEDLFYIEKRTNQDD